MKRVYSSSFMRQLFVILILFPLCLTSFFTTTSSATDATVIISAEGLSDPNAVEYLHDKKKLNDALLDDAKKQAIEKVVGMYVDKKSLEENYKRLDDKVLTQTGGFIKRIIQKSEPWLGEDGFMHILIKAEVYTTKAHVALQEMSRSQRIQFLSAAGNPRISVAVTVRDHDRGSNTGSQRSSIAENVLKEHISEFGYRVWSEEAGQGRTGQKSNDSLSTEKKESSAYSTNVNATDFVIYGDVKFKENTIKLQTSGMEITTFQITSWTVKCIDTFTGEELYFNNTLPSRKSWKNEDEALKAVGDLIGQEFSQEFFNQHLMQKTATYDLEVQSLPAYEAAVLFKKELIGLRPILNVELRSFDKTTGALYEVEFSGRELDFSEYVNDNVLTPLNYKFGHRAFSLASVHKQRVNVIFQSSKNSVDIVTLFREKPPSSLAMATPVRLNQIAATKGTLEKVEELNPNGVKVVREHRRSGGKTSLDVIRDF